MLLMLEKFDKNDDAMVMILWFRYKKKVRTKKSHCLDDHFCRFSGPEQSWTKNKKFIGWWISDPDADRWV